MGGKLLYIINHLDWFWSHRLPLAQGAQNQSWDVMVGVTDATKDQKLKEMGFTGLELPSAEGGFAPFKILKITWAIHKLLQKQKPSIVHAITLKYAFMTGLAARFHKNICVVHTIAGLGYLFSGEGFKPKLLRFLIGPFLKLALKGRNMQIIFQNPDDQKLLIERSFVRAEQCTLIRGSGVDLQQFSLQELPPNKTPIILMPTRLVHDKGIAVFIEAARILKSRNINAKFQIAGGITKNNPLAISQKDMEDMVADGAVEWLGKVNDMPALFAGANLIVYPSYYREGIPKVLLEAAAMAKPIITTDHPGCREAVNDGENGLLVPIKDPQATANAIEILLKDPARCLTMGENSRLRAQKEFDVNLIVAKTLEVYQKA